LRWLVDQGSVERDGAGRKGDPYRYWLSDRDLPYGTTAGNDGGKED
jgi:hypothetical protein